MPTAGACRSRLVASSERPAAVCGVRPPMATDRRSAPPRGDRAGPHGLRAGGASASSLAGVEVPRAVAARVLTGSPHPSGRAVRFSAPFQCSPLFVTPAARRVRRAGRSHAAPGGRTGWLRAEPGGSTGWLRAAPVGLPVRRPRPLPLRPAPGQAIGHRAPGPATRRAHSPRAAAPETGPAQPCAAAPGENQGGSPSGRGTDWSV